MWKHLKDRLTLSKEALLERNADTLLTGFSRMNDTMLSEYENCAQTFEVREWEKERQRRGVCEDWLG